MFPGFVALQNPNHPAVIMASTGAITTFRELDEAANKLSQVLRAAGLDAGDHVAFCLENHPRYFEILWGCHYAGLIYTACSSRLTTDELSYIINDCGAKAFITSKFKSEQAVEILATTPNISLRLMVDGVVNGYDSFEDAVSKSPNSALPDRIDGVDMLYSSGTTGRPKGIKLGLEMTPLGTATAMTALCSVLFGMDDSTIYLSPAPLYHAAPLRFTMTAQRLGGTVIIMEHFDPDEYLALVERFRVTHSQLVPTMFVRMLKLNDTARSKHSMSSLKCAIHAAAPCPIEVKHKMIQWWGPVIHEYYAGSEGNGFVYCNSAQWLAHPGTVGTSINAVVHICDDQGNELPTREPGTVYFESKVGFEYHNDPEKTKHSRDPQGRGWTTLGDVGYLDEENYLYLTDRKAFMIISGGVNVYPQEAENILINHPKVIDVAVFGVPNDEFGEEVKAVVQPVSMPQTAGESADLERELKLFCRDYLADLKCPRSIDFRNELPRHPTGKLYKRLLKDEYWKHSGRAI